MSCLGFQERVRLFQHRDDRRSWKLDKTGLFSCKSYNFFLLNSGSRQLSLFLPQIWKSKVPPKIKFHVWLLALGKLNTCDQIQRRRPSFYLSPLWCVLCKSHLESVDHVFLHCPFSGGVYLGSPAGLSLKTVLISCVLSLRLWVGGRKPQLYGNAWCMLVFGIFGWSATEEFFMIVRKKVSRKSRRRLDIGLLFGLQLPQFLRIITLLSLCWI